MPDVEKAIVEAASMLLPEVYSDALSSAMKQIGHIGEDALKTFRLILFPLQYTSALQDRLAQYIDEAVRKVPEHRLVAPPQSMTIQICEKLKTFDEREEFRSLYINLLARLIDGERVGEAHPAFVNVISQLAPDEVCVIKQFAKIVDSKYHGRLMVSVRTETRNGPRRRDLSLSEAKSWIDRRVDNVDSRLLLSLCLVPEEISQPEMFFVFQEHLVSLGIVEFTNESKLHVLGKEAQTRHLGLEFHCLQLTKFGQLFHRACVAAEA